MLDEGIVQKRPFERSRTPTLVKIWTFKMGPCGSELSASGPKEHSGNPKTSIQQFCDPNLKLSAARHCSLQVPIMSFDNLGAQCRDQGLTRTRVGASEGHPSGMWGLCAALCS